MNTLQDIIIYMRVNAIHENRIGKIEEILYNKGWYEVEIRYASEGKETTHFYLKEDGVFKEMPPFPEKVEWLSIDAIENSYDMELVHVYLHHIDIPCKTILDKLFPPSSLY